MYRRITKQDVDSWLLMPYNQPKVLSFYERNKFKYLYATEELERAEQHFPETSPVYTRLMFLDLLHTQILEYPNVIK